MKYLVLFLLVMISDANAYDVMNDIRLDNQIAALSGEEDNITLPFWIVIGIILVFVGLSNR